MKKLFIIFIFINFISCSSHKVSLNDIKSANKNYQIIFKKGQLYSHFFGGNTRKFGKTKDEAVNLYRLDIQIIIEGLSRYSIVDFNNFSLIEHKNKLRHRPEFVNIEIPFSSPYTISRIDKKEFKGVDTFLKYSQPGYDNYDQYLLEHNSISILLNRSKQHRFATGILPKKAIKRKKFSIFFFTKIKKEGVFSLFYKDELIKKFTLKK